MLRAGLRCAAIWSYDLLLCSLPAPEDGPPLTDPMLQARAAMALRLRQALSEQRPLNPTAEFWRVLLEAGFPFVKRELLCRNPSRVQDLADWRPLLIARNCSGVDLIDQDLQRTLRDRTP